MRVYEQLEQEATQRQQKLKIQLELIMEHTKLMREDLGGSEEAR